MNAAAMLDALQAYIAGALPDRPNSTAHELASISVGWESDVYAFDLESGECSCSHLPTVYLFTMPIKRVRRLAVMLVECISEKG